MHLERVTHVDCQLIKVAKWKERQVAMCTSYVTSIGICQQMVVHNLSKPLHVVVALFAGGRMHVMWHHSQIIAIWLLQHDFICLKGSKNKVVPVENLSQWLVAMSAISFSVACHRWQTLHPLIIRAYYIPLFSKHVKDIMYISFK